MKSPTGAAASRAASVGPGSQAGAYAALLFGGVLLVAAAKGNSIRDVLSGAKSPVRPLTSKIPASFQTTGTSTAGTTSAGRTGASNAQLSSAGYTSPLGAGWTQERTDQGVDFAPSYTGAPIYSPGNARVVQVGAPGWPSGEKGVLLKLLDGPLKGKNVFIYEAIQPSVRVGQIVHAGQQVGSGVFGETGIEVGFADSAGVPLSHPEYTEGKVTVWGTKMQHWLESLPGFLH